MLPLALTPGEPAGIGPECVLRYRAGHPDSPLVAVADPELLRATAQQLNLDIDIAPWTPGEAVARGALSCLPVSLAAPAVAGQLNPANAAYVLETLRVATRLVQSGDAAGLVTGPVHKGIINDAGEAFTGHTEFLAALADVPRVVMMLAAGPLRVALVTTHMPLSAVPAAITPEAVSSAINITLDALQQRFHIAQPRLQVLGLNPHAGEGGHLGFEDDAIIAPAMAACARSDVSLIGPVPADAAFKTAALAECDGVLAMYHDQGLPVLKHAAAGRAVNITLGLPFIRTSVDHGTAIDIAGRGIADPASLACAIEQALEMAASQ
jgi:4-hydroxythreonine-4-phosphate dehydrogenase